MYDKILVPIDGSPTSQCGLKEAIKIAKSQGSIVRLLHVVNEFMFDYTYSSGMNTTTVIDALRDAGKRSGASTRPENRSLSCSWGSSACSR